MPSWAPAHFLQAQRVRIAWRRSKPGERCSVGLSRARSARCSGVTASISEIYSEFSAFSAINISLDYHSGQLEAGALTYKRLKFFEIKIACVRLFTSNFANIILMCIFTVASVSLSSLAICLFDKPEQMQRKTCSCRGVKVGVSGLPV